MADWMKELDHAQADTPQSIIPTILTKAEKKSIEDYGSIEHRGKDLKKPGIEGATSRLERIAKWKGHPVDDLLDWYKDDLQDLAGKPDKDLQFIVCEYLDNLTLYRGAPQAETFNPHCVRCIDCQHFTRTDHPHLGKCGAGVNQSAVAGFWDESLRGCSEYQEKNDAV